MTNTQSMNQDVQTCCSFTDSENPAPNKRWSENHETPELKLRVNVCWSLVSGQRQHRPKTRKQTKRLFSSKVK